MVADLANQKRVDKQSLTGCLENPFSVPSVTGLGWLIVSHERKSRLRLTL